MSVLLHDLEDFGDLIEVAASEVGIDPGLVEKDYWIMHALWGLQAGGYRFELKGGTSLSKGFGLIHRFSEDIDILIHPEEPLPVGKNHSKPQHVAARGAFFDGLAHTIDIPGFRATERDKAFDDPTGQMRGAGIRLLYSEINALPAGVKTGILLEAGFDQVSPNRAVTISSWAYDFAVARGVEDLIDNRARDVACYEPGYTFVEKLQTVSTKFRQQQETGGMPSNFMRHYYDLWALLQDPEVQAFIGSEAYAAHKAARFRPADEQPIAINPAFRLDDPRTRALYEAAYRNTSALYYREQPPLNAILDRIAAVIDRL